MQKITHITGLALLAIGLVVNSGCSTALAQDQGVERTTRRTISVSGSGSVRVDPDIATAVLGVTKTDPNLPAAKSACDAAIAQVKAALKRTGIADEDVQSIQYQIRRINQNPQAGIRQAVWSVTHTLQVRTEKPDTIANVVDAAVGAGATDVQNIYFSVDSLAKHRTKSRELAVQAATEKAQQLAALLKVNIGEVISISEGGDGYYPMAQMSANMSFDGGGGMGGGSGISGGQIEVNTTTQVVFGIR